LQLEAARGHPATSIGVSIGHGLLQNAECAIRVAKKKRQRSKPPPGSRLVVHSAVEAAPTSSPTGLNRMVMNGSQRCQVQSGAKRAPPLASRHRALVDKSRWVRLLLVEMESTVPFIRHFSIVRQISATSGRKYERRPLAVRVGRRRNLKRQPIDRRNSGRA
jgi:hypothetical protein